MAGLWFSHFLLCIHQIQSIQEVFLPLSDNNEVNTCLRYLTKKNSGLTPIQEQYPLINCSYKKLIMSVRILFFFLSFSLMLLDKLLLNFVRNKLI